MSARVWTYVSADRDLGADGPGGAITVPVGIYWRTAEEAKAHYQADWDKFRAEVDGMMGSDPIEWEEYGDGCWIFHPFSDGSPSPVGGSMEGLKYEESEVLVYWLEPAMDSRQVAMARLFRGNSTEEDTRVMGEWAAEIGESANEVLSKVHLEMVNAALVDPD